MKNIKLVSITVFVLVGTAMALLTNNRLVGVVKSYEYGPPAARTGAPGERTCTECHVASIYGYRPDSASSPQAQFEISAPVNYAPGTTYTITVTHRPLDTDRRAWGFEMTALDENGFGAGTFSSTTPFTQTLSQGTRQYIEHNTPGSFYNQATGAQWTFNWKAPSSNIGSVTFYAAGNQANGDGTSDGDLIMTAQALTMGPAAASPSPTPTPTPSPSPSATRTPTPTPTPVGSPTPAGRKVGSDFDGDGKTDVAVFRPSNGNWYVNRSRDGFYGQNFGAGTDKLAPADYDGDGKTDVAVYRPSSGVFFIYRSSDGGDGSAYWGLPEDIPTPGDFDGDGKADIAIFRPSTSQFWIRQSASGNAPLVIQYGTSGDQPVVGDYDGDGKADVAVYRPSTGIWFMHLSKTNTDTAAQFGTPTDKAVPGDFDGDGKTDIAVYRSQTGVWFIVNSTGGFTSYQFGFPTDTPAPGDYDGDGKIDMAIFRPAEGNFWINASKNGISVLGWGTSGDMPIANAYVR